MQREPRLHPNHGPALQILLCRAQGSIPVLVGSFAWGLAQGLNPHLWCGSSSEHTKHTALGDTESWGTQKPAHKNCYKNRINKSSALCAQVLLSHFHKQIHSSGGSQVKSSLGLFLDEIWKHQAFPVLRWEFFCRAVFALCWQAAPGCIFRATKLQLELWEPGVALARPVLEQSAAPGMEVSILKAALTAVNTMERAQVWSFNFYQA